MNMNIECIESAWLHHAFFVVKVPFIPRFASEDFRTANHGGKTRTELVTQRQVRFINDLHRANLLRAETAEQYSPPSNEGQSRLNAPAFELRYISRKGQITIALIGKVSHSERNVAIQLCHQLWEKFIAHYPLEDPFNYPFVIPDREERKLILEPINLSEVTSDRLLEIRKFDDLSPLLIRNLQGYYPHRFIPTFDLSAMARFLETLVRQDQSCVVSIWLRPTVLDDKELRFIMRHVAQSQPERVLSLIKGTDAIEKDWAFFYLKERHDDIYTTFWPIINRRNHLFEFKIQILSDRRPAIDVMESLGSELLGNTFKDEPRLWRSVSPSNNESLGKAKSNFRYLEAEYWDTESVFDTLELDEGQLSLVRRLARLVTPNEAAGSFRLPIPPESGYLPGIPVRSEPFVAPFIQSQTNQQKDSVSLGKIMHHGQVTEQEFRIPFASFNQHILIGGATGTGKTNTCLSLLTQLYKQEIPFLVMYPLDKSDYRLLMGDDEINPDLLIYTVGDESVAPFRFNPFYIAKGIALKTHISSLMRCFAAAFSMWDPLPAVYRESLYTLYRECNWDTLNGHGGDPGGHTPTMSRFYEVLVQKTQEMTADYDEEAKGRVRQSAEIRIRDLLVNTGSVLNVEGAGPFDVILQRPTVMELGRLGSQQDIALVMSFITMLLVEALQSKYKQLPFDKRQAQGLQHVTLIEEAHRVMPSAQHTASGPDLANPAVQGAEDFANILAEIRGFGEGIIIAEQIPVQLVNGAVGNTNLKIMHRLEDQESFRLFADVLNLNPQQRDFSRSLERGYVIVRDQHGQPVQVKVASYLNTVQTDDDKPKFDDADEVVKKKMLACGVAVPPAQLWMPNTPSAQQSLPTAIQPLFQADFMPTGAEISTAQDLRTFLQDLCTPESNAITPEILPKIRSLLSSLSNRLPKAKNQIPLLIEVLRYFTHTEPVLVISEEQFLDLMRSFGMAPEQDELLKLVYQTI